MTREADGIVLASGTHVDPQEVEAHYERSPFIREVCVLGVHERGERIAERLHAIVVPDVDVLRKRRIVNVVELIRYEMEGLSVSLPDDRRVRDFTVTFARLPRSATSELRRHEILARYRGPSAPDASPAESTVEPSVQRLVDTIQSMMRPGIVVHADSNLELDLGLDSLERVELLASLEHRLGARLPRNVADSAFVVRDLGEAFAQTERPPADAPHASWASLLQDGEPDATLKALLKPRRLYVLVLFLVARVAVRVLARARVRGIDRLLPDGPFIICPNHQSYLDPFLVMGVLPFRVFRRLFFVGAAEYFESPLTRWLAARLNIVLVDPDANLLSAMRAGAFGLRHGKVLMLFPEGERSIDGGVKKFRKGAAILSRELGAPIVPVTIDGMFEIWPRTRPLRWRTLLPWSGHRTMVCVGDPLPPSDNVIEQTARLREIVERTWRACQRDL
jgi:long-chain acyl-CoA synthetase